MTDLTISIVTYKNDRTIVKSLEALFYFSPPSIKQRVFIIDNASSENTKNVIKSFAERVTLIQSDRGNIGFGAAHNLILEGLDSRYHVIMNPDIYLQDGRALLILMDYLDSHPEVGMVVPKIIDEQGELQFLCRRNPTILDLFLRFIPGNLWSRRQDYHTMKDQDYNTSFEVEFASGCFMMIRTKLFKQLGGFDDQFFLYVEDADLTRRVNMISKTVYVPQAIVCHAWQRASYSNPAMAKIHLKSLLHYFRKWGFRYK